MARRIARSPLNAEQMREHAGDAAQLLKVLANEKRLMTLCLLVDAERPVGELNALLDLSQSALSQHLAVLRDDDLVQTRREAKSIVYSIATGPAQGVLRTLHAVYCGADA